MILRLHTPSAAYFSDIAEVLHIFFPSAEVKAAEANACDVLHAHSERHGAGCIWAEDRFTYKGQAFRWTTQVTGDKWERKRRRKRGMKQCCYYLLRLVTGIAPPWGSLTGIRPTRLLYERLARGEKPDAARDAVIRLFDVREDKAQLIKDTVLTQRGLIGAPLNAVDVYVGIPFCKSRCAYCSFFAESVGNGKKIGPYLDALLLELDAVSDIIRAKGLALRALYVGGGTPTALDSHSLELLIGKLAALFSRPLEWTVEAGRPDTIDVEKLRVMRDAGVTRITVNPQTMNDNTLRVIGRLHTAADTRLAYQQARAAGFSNINMDVIAALPGEDAEAFLHTLDAIEALAPDSLTVHTLARKHGSRFNEFGFEAVDTQTAEIMVEMGAGRAKEMGMRPYYLYRQKYVTGNLENVAYAKPGKECLYNVDMMEETVSILSAGAGAISKRLFPLESRIERAPNVGDVGHYLARIDEMIRRKKRLWEVLE